jgi:hypothetical protein
VAKDKKSDEPFLAPTVGVSPVDPKDAEIERLKKELEDAKAASSNPAATPPSVTLDGPKKKFLVDFANGPKWVVEAVHESLALVEFLKITGMISFPAPPTVREVEDSVPSGEYKG